MLSDKMRILQTEGSGHKSWSQSQVLALQNSRQLQSSAGTPTKEYA